MPQKGGGMEIIMKKQFNAINELNERVEEILTESGFYDKLKPFEFLRPDMHKVAIALESEGYDLDDLVADGHGYEIDGHTNNGWLYEDEVNPLDADKVILKKMPE